MGSGAWDTDRHSRTVTASLHATGGASTSAYSYHTTTTLPPNLWKTHESLDPKGMVMRESRDSVEHPRSCPIIVWLDVTGSNKRMAEIIQKKLPQLNGLLLRKGYIDDPQILFGAIGDCTAGDRASLQVGQFESDNRMDENLANILLEGGGGGGGEESYQNALYVTARMTASDAWDKRRQKGYVFIIGDEMAYPRVKREEISRLIGRDEQEDIPTEQIMDEVLERYNVFYIFPRLSSHGTGPTHEVHMNYWRDMLGQNVIELDDPDGISELIGLSIGLVEGSTDLSGGMSDLRDIGTSDRTLTAVTTALKNHDSSALSVVSSGGTLTGLDGSSDSTARRV